MIPQLLTVSDVHKAIDDMGVLPYRDALVRDWAGDYWFIDCETIDNDMVERFEAEGWTCEPHQYDPGEDCKNLDDYFHIAYQVRLIPLRIAYFIISALSIKSQMNQLTVPMDENIRNGRKQAVYLPAGAEFMGQRIDKLTEIPAELRPLVVESL